MFDKSYSSNVIFLFNDIKEGTVILIKYMKRFVQHAMQSLLKGSEFKGYIYM